MSASTPRRSSRPTRFWVWLTAITLLAAAIRFGAIFNDLWLDEIWSLRLLEGARTAPDILTRLWNDNNHPLNSLFLYWLKPAKYEWTYRLLSWATGVATVWLAGLLGRLQFQRLHPEREAGDGNRAGLVTAVLFGGSYLLIQYATEARGYAPAVFFSLAALYAFARGVGRSWSVWTGLYWCACLLGMASHVVSLQVLVGCVCWSVAIALPSWPRNRRALAEALRWHLVPGVVFGAYYWEFVRHLAIGGGPRYALVDVLSDLAAFTLGTPQAAGLVVALPLLLLVVSRAAWHIWAQDRGLATCYVAAMIIAPIVSLVSNQFILLFPRYFIVSAALALLLVGHELGWAMAFRPSWRKVCAAAMAVFLAGGVTHTARLFRDGRGQYRAALTYVLEHTSTPTITVSSASQFRNRMVIEHHARALPSGERIVFCSNTSMPPEGPQWLFLDFSHDGPAPLDEVTVVGHRYRLERIFLSAALSGWDWYVYAQEY